MRDNHSDCNCFCLRSNFNNCWYIGVNDPRHRVRLFFNNFNVRSSGTNCDDDALEIGCGRNNCKFKIGLINK